MKHALIGLTLILHFCATGVLGQHQHSPAPVKTTALAIGLGPVGHPVSTSNAEAQRFFNQGLAYVYAFNHHEAVRSFQRAVALDPQLAMGHWGIALALGSNYNLQADAPQRQQAYANLQKSDLAGAQLCLKRKKRGLRRVAST